MENYDEVKNAIVNGTQIQRIEDPTRQGMTLNAMLPQKKIDLIKLWASKGFINQ